MSTKPQYAADDLQALRNDPAVPARDTCAHYNPDALRECARERSAAEWDEARAAYEAAYTEAVAVAAAEAAYAAEAAEAAEAIAEVAHNMSGDGRYPTARWALETLADDADEAGMTATADALRTLAAASSALDGQVRPADGE